MNRRGDSQAGLDRQEEINAGDLHLLAGRSGLESPSTDRICVPGTRTRRKVVFLIEWEECELAYVLNLPGARAPLKSRWNLNYPRKWQAANRLVGYETLMDQGSALDF